MKRNGILIMLICFISANFIGFAQNQKINPENAIKWTFEEKVKLSPEQLLKFSENLSPEKKSEVIKHFKSTTANGEINISNNDKVEAEIHAAINPTDTNNLVASPIRQDFSTSSISCPIYYTTNFGNTWTESAFKNMPYEAGKISGGGGDPVFAYDADGKLYFSWIDLYGTQSAFLFGTVNMGIFWAYSTDGGATWIKPTNDTILLGGMQMVFGSPSSITSPISDKQWMACDHSSSQYRNNLYVSYVTLAQSGQTTTYQIKCKTKPAAQNRFTHEAAITTPTPFSFVQFSSLGVDNNGNVHVIFYGTNDGSTMAIWHSVSTDGGVTFSSPNKVSNVKFNLPILQVTPYDTIQGIDANRTYPSPYMACDPNNGNVYVTWTAFGISSNAGTGSDVYFSRSTDNGSTWSTPFKVNDDATTRHNYYSSIYVKQNGEVKVSWYDRREDAANINAHYYYATSTDGGLTFGTNKKATTVPTNFTKVGLNNQKFGIGEYTQVLASNNYTIPVWCDGRTNDGNLNVYAAFINDLTVGIDKISAISDNIKVGNIYPNPVRTKVNLHVALKEKTSIEIKIIDIKGNTIQEFVPFKYDAGEQDINFNIDEIANGNYYLVLNTDFGYTVRPLQVQK